MAVAESDRQKGEYVLIIEDKGQKEGLHILKNRYFKSHDMEVLRAPLPVGDYIIATDKVADVIHRKSARKMELKKMDFLGTYDVSVDTKKDMQEIVGNICGKHIRDSVTSVFWRRTTELSYMCLLKIQTRCIPSMMYLHGIILEWTGITILHICTHLENC